MTHSRMITTLRDALMEAVYERRALPSWVLNLVSDHPKAVLTIYKAVEHHTEGHTPDWHLKLRLEEILTDSLGNTDPPRVESQLAKEAS